MLRNNSSAADCERRTKKCPFQDYRHDIELQPQQTLPRTVRFLRLHVRQKGALQEESKRTGYISSDTSPKG